MTALRPPAVPLVTVDPYLSIWSFNNNLHEGVTRTGRSGITACAGWL
ncbi:DUF4964 domain-containing protein [Paenibacillus filicis]|uniref:DUF4964 domain-containing protein n=1 Tax=Paenibacillus gyeongsangnamensis TaxID=3388067 RepID=A0ABT4Q487_9BACL|nr:DUF4964 domain-containing protein [Paenibacillus filicis]MCZ8511597.1 DUF4964 domain-containing protein [Paenibacillus filicis]